MLQWPVPYVFILVRVGGICSSRLPGHGKVANLNKHEHDAWFHIGCLVLTSIDKNVVVHGNNVSV